MFVFAIAEWGDDEGVFFMVFENIAFGCFVDNAGTVFAFLDFGRAKHVDDKADVGHPVCIGDPVHQICGVMCLVLVCMCV